MFFYACLLRYLLTGQPVLTFQNRQMLFIDFHTDTSFCSQVGNYKQYNTHVRNCQQNI